MVKKDKNRELFHRLIEEHKDTPLKWFDQLYGQAGCDMSVVPWADGIPNQHLVEWVKENQPDGKNKTCCIVGCGLGDDAEYLSNIFDKTEAFDISPNAIDWCKKRFVATKVNYYVADLLLIDKTGYDFVFEAYTLQVLPDVLRKKAIEKLQGLLSSKGQLLIICRGREDEEPQNELIPYMLTRKELDLPGQKLELKQFEEFYDTFTDPPVKRFRLLYQNP